VGTLLLDLRYAARSLAKSPAFTAAAVLTLAIGIGANTALFSVVDALLLRALPYRESDRLVRISGERPGLDLDEAGLSVPELDDLRARTDLIEDVTGVYPITANLTGGERPRRVETLLVGENYFTLLGTTPSRGRLFDSRDAVPGIGPVAVISDALWRSTFGGDPRAVGSTVRIDIDPYTIVGVLPPEFRHPGRTLATDVEVWVPTGFRASPFGPPNRGETFLAGALARLRPGLDPAAAQARLDALSASLREAHGDAYAAADRWRLRTRPLREDLVADVRTGILVLQGAVGLVLLLACVNVAGLLLARASARRGEIAVRRALGAGRGRLVRQMLTESLLLAGVGAAAGLSVALWATGALADLLPSGTPQVHAVRVDGRVLAFTLAVALASGVVFGLVPALRASSPAVGEDLREGARAGTAAGHARLRAGLVAAQIALALVLLVGAGLLARSLAELLRVSPGFEPRNVLQARFWLPQPNDPPTGPYFALDRRAAFAREVLRRIESLPGVDGAAASNDPPVSETGWYPTLVPRSGPHAGEPASAKANAVTPGWFAQLGVPLVAGRMLAETDVVDRPPVVLVNETFARRHWPDGEAVGQPLGFGPADSDAPVFDVVGVVGDVRAEGLDVEPPPQIFLPLYQFPSLSGTVLVRASGDPAALAAAVEREIRAVDPDVPVYDVRSLEAALAADVAPRRASAVLLGVFACAALLLAAIGVYGVASYVAHLRTREIGIRLALGATARDVLRLTLRQGVVLTGAGLAAGVAASLALTGLLRALLFGVGARDVGTFAAVTVVLAAAALAASWIPARRAARTDPLTVLRYE
jgi:putative ABC transport system permease protein